MTKINVPRKRAEYHKTFTTIFQRMKNHKVALYDYIDQGSLKVYESQLDGIEFKTRKPLDFLDALRTAMIVGKQSFREGKKFDHAHWTVDMSMAATKGIGFREITYLGEPNLRQNQPSLLQMRPKMDSTFSAQFTKNSAKIDITSLHCAVWGDFCSIHVDESGFVLQPIPGLSQDVMMTPDFLQHTLLELLWKGIPGMPEGVEIYVPNSANNYSATGLRASAELTSNIKLTLNASYTVRGTRGFSKTLSLEGVF
ncbi:MAG: hypothetical protein HKN36_00810 [Hellea sp.]|nr:hypothetical protein [Hellea sp.]